MAERRGEKVGLWGLVLTVALAWGAAQVAAEPKGKLVLGLEGEPTTFDPHVTTSLPMLFQYPQVFDTLLFRDPAGKIVPHLAASYRLAEPRVWEFKIREGVRFTNGEPADAHAVKYSIERILDPKLKSQQYAYFRSIQRVEAVDRTTARIHTKYPDMLLPSVLALYGQVVPPEYYRSRSPEYLARHPVGSGPYRLVRWRKGDEIVYEANPGYRNPSMQRVKAGIVKHIPEATTRVAALVAGDVDLIDVVPPQLVPVVRANPHLEVLSAPSPRTCFVMMLIKPGAPWDDVRVRQALNHAVDKDSITQHIFRGYAEKINVLQALVSFGYNPALRPYPYDAARARELLAEAGYPKGFSVDMYVPAGRYQMGEQGAEAVSGQLEKVGVKAQVRILKWDTLVTRMKVRWEPQVRPFFWYSCRSDATLHADGQFVGFIHSRSTYGGVRDKSLDRLMDEARAEIDDAERERKYREINRVLHEEKAPLIFLYQINQIHAKNKRVDWGLRADGNVLLVDAGLKE